MIDQVTSRIGEPKFDATSQKQRARVIISLHTSSRLKCQVQVPRWPVPCLGTKSLSQDHVHEKPTRIAARRSPGRRPNQRSPARSTFPGDVRHGRNWTFDSQGVLDVGSRQFVTRLELPCLPRRIGECLLSKALEPWKTCLRCRRDFHHPSEASTCRVLQVRDLQCSAGAVPDLQMGDVRIHGCVPIAQRRPLAGKNSTMGLATWIKPQQNGLSMTAI